ncbi:leucine-rich repeat, immunoglobulin-like domain and transmembrane domain-containing protein 2 [Leptidea sinapis]|uniref:leucine-rich repeat, immunoglobulin-like domain and transmembrane domain-containing protein 2 n=1 Tax=Leptidea sinapis TaxID=189913 RepID=UPI002143992C|nr:leucine-rich repeat, immunoglobulin-like domain and transmembrane domain-containing protein 2 [Leptidea sinapis]
MGIRANCYLLFVVFHITPIGSDWLTCAHIAECQCKWSSGKKTASCVNAGLNIIPRLASDIQVLYLNGNPLKQLQEDTFVHTELLNLQRLNLSATNLHFLHQNAFRELRILIELDLSRNELMQLAPDTFKGNERLRLLVLNDNPLSKLVAEQFPPLQHLKKLELSRCQLRKIHAFAFVNLQALEIVYIHQNELTYLHQETFNLPFIKTLTLSQNPWYCDCKLREFHEWFLMSNLGSEEVVCAGPANQKDISWRGLKSKDLVCPPSAQTSPSVLRTEAGADITFGCFIKGDPIPSVSWSFHLKEMKNDSNRNSDILIQRYRLRHNEEYIEDIVNKSAQWINVTINNVTSDFAGEWKCTAKSNVGEASAFLTISLPKARTATTSTAPDHSNLFITIGSMLAMAGAGFVATCILWKTRRRRMPPSRSYTDQEKKLLDTSLAVSCERSSTDMGSSYGCEIYDGSISLESDDAEICMEPVQLTVEGIDETFPPPPAEFSLPAPYSNIFISVQVAGHDNKYPDLLGGGATLPRRSRTCFIKPTYDNMGPRVTAAGSSTLSLPEVDPEIQTNIVSSSIPLSTFSTEYTAL